MKKTRWFLRTSGFRAARRFAVLALWVGFFCATAQGFSFDPVTNTWRAVESVAPTRPDVWDDGGAGVRASWTFGPNVRVHPADGAQHVWPNLVSLPDGKLYAAWMDDRTGTYKIYGAVSTDRGLTWQADQRIDDAAPAAMSRFVSLAVLGDGRIGAVWEDVRTGGWNWNVFFSRGVWNPGLGAFVWSSSIRVNTTGGSTSAGDYMHPSLAADRFGRISAAWTDWRDGVFYQIYFRSSTDGGTTWGNEVRISDQIGYQPVAGDPSLAVDMFDNSDPPALLCTWNDWRGNVGGGRYPEVYFARSTDGGVSWTIPNVRVNDITDYYQQVAMRVVTATLSGVLAIGWFNDDFSGPSEMRVSRSTNDGMTWSASTALSEPVTGGGVPVNLTGGIGNDLLASWMGYAGDWNVYFRASGDAGVGWGSVVRVDDDATGAATYNPIIIALPDGNPMVALQDTRPGLAAYNIWVAPGIRDPALVEPAAGSTAGSLWIAPNPARGAAVLRWMVPATDPAHLRIVDITGRIMLDEPAPAAGDMIWRPGARGSAPAAAGIYYVLLAGQSGTLRTRLTLLP